jgi:hypothetical protein
MARIAGGFGRYLQLLLAVLMVQGATALLVVVALDARPADTWPLFAALGAAVGALGAFWLSALGTAQLRDALAHAGERHAREREDLAARLSREREEARVAAERRRAEDLRQNERLAAKARQHGFGPTLRAGLAAGGIAGAGVALVLAQFVTLGLVAVAGAGGAALGYAVRRRQERLTAAWRGDAPPLIDADPPPTPLPRPAKGRRLPSP